MDSSTANVVDYRTLRWIYLGSAQGSGYTSPERCLPERSPWKGKEPKTIGRCALKYPLIH